MAEHVARLLLVDEPTMRSLAGRMATRALGKVALRGKAQPVAVHAVVPGG